MSRDTRQRIIDTTIKLLLFDGYTHTGINELCAQAGVQKGSFYHFFASKQDLLLEALDVQWRFQQEAVLRPAFASDLPPLDRLQRLFEISYHYQCAAQAAKGFAPGCAFGNIAQELSIHDERIRLKVAQIFQEFVSYLQQVLADAVAAGELPPIDTAKGAQAILSYLEGVMLLAKNQNDPTLILTLAPAARSLVLALK